MIETMKFLLFEDWAQRTPHQILADVNAGLAHVWEVSGYVHPPTRIEVPYREFGFLSVVLVMTPGGPIAIKRYIEQNNLVTVSAGKLVEIVASDQGAMVVSSQSHTSRFEWVR